MGYTGSIPGGNGAEGMLACEPTDGQDEELVGGARGMFMFMGIEVMFIGLTLVLGSLRLPIELCWSEDSWCFSLLPPRPRR